jgi:hypothetical protein
MRTAACTSLTTTAQVMIQKVDEHNERRCEDDVPGRRLCWAGRTLSEPTAAVESTTTVCPLPVLSSASFQPLWKCEGPSPQCEPRGPRTRAGQPHTLELSRNRVEDENG